jgi:hypothetical protein
VKPIHLVVILIALGFLGVQVYDRVKAHRDEVAAHKAAHNKEVYDGLARCEDSLAYPPADWPTYLKARQDCQHFWLPQLEP